MDPTGAIYAAAGVAMFLAALLPRLLQRAPISLPMIFLATGIVLFSRLDWLPTLSVVIRGVTAGSVMHMLDKRRKAVAKEHGDPGKASVTAV